MAQKIQKPLNLDVKSQNKFIEFYKKQVELPNKDASRLFNAFERGDYYSIHGRDIDVALKTTLKSSIIIKKMSPAEGIELKYASLNKNLAERLIRELLLVFFYRVQIYTSKKGERDEYELMFKGSPGNLIQFENILANSSHDSEVFSNLLVSLQVVSSNQLKKIALCAIDSDEQTIQVVEIDDTDFWMELESLLVILSPKEVILPAITGEYTKIKEILDRNSILITLVKKGDFAKNAEFLQDLEKLYRFRKGQQHNIYAIPEIKFDLAMGSLAAGLKYLETIKEEGNLGKFSIKVLNLDRFVHMDTAAFTALNLFPTPGSNYRSDGFKQRSVLGVLDRCKTNQGRRMLRQWIKQPLRSEDLIKERLDVLESLVENQETRLILYKDYLNIIPDVLMLTNKLSRKRAGLIDVFKIYQVILRLPDILRLLKGLDSNAVNIMLYSPLKDLMQDLKKIEDMVEEVMDIDGLKKGEYFVRASFDEQLQEIKEKMDAIEAKMRKETKSYAKILGLTEGTSLKLDFVSHLGFYLRTTRKEHQNIKKYKQFLQIDTARGGLRITTAFLKDLNEEYAEYKKAYEDQQKTIVTDICRITAGYSIPLTALNHIIATLDVFTSLAQVVTNSPGVYTRPEIFSEENRILEIKALRHPCLECQEDVQYIPNDVDMKSGESDFLIISGANISGKSTYIRSIGIAVLLAQIGMFVPCDEAKISICDSILARIGATDDIQKNLSTFAMEMVETGAILKTATRSSLIIIDELGRGTSTFEGLGLAWAISEYLAKEVKCFTLFATHFHEITQMSNLLPNVKNYHLASLVQNEKLTLLFQLKPTAMTKSFGIEVADIAQLPKIVVQNAKLFLTELEIGEKAEEKTKGNEILEKVDSLLDKIKNDKTIDIDTIIESMLA